MWACMHEHFKFIHISHNINTDTQLGADPGFIIIIFFFFFKGGGGGTDRMSLQATIKVLKKVITY